MDLDAFASIEDTCEGGRGTNSNLDMCLFPPSLVDVDVDDDDDQRSHPCVSPMIIIDCFVVVVVLVSPEMTIQSSVLSSSRLLLNCTIIARPLNSAKWKRNRVEMSNVKRTQINDYTVELLLLLEVNANRWKRVSEVISSCVERFLGLCLSLWSARPTNGDVFIFQLD